MYKCTKKCKIERNSVIFSLYISLYILCTFSKTYKNVQTVLLRGSSIRTGHTSRLPPRTLPDLVCVLLAVQFGMGAHTTTALDQLRFDMIRAVVHTVHRKMLSNADRDYPNGPVTACTVSKMAFRAALVQVGSERAKSILGGIERLKRLFAGRGNWRG